MILTLFMIVKNESSIITRCLDSVKKYIDYIVISDTGSTDNTVEIIKNYLSINNIKGNVYNDEWIDFGFNRTKSLKNAQEWLSENTGNIENNSYFLTIDADMVINFSDSFKKTDLLKYDYWNICQYNNSIRYYNSRFFKSSLPFKCIGVTHEYWGCDVSVSQGKMDTVSIDDRGDGGCKSDKFERDIKLLTKGLQNEPNNHRYYFYLAQSYADYGDTEKAIEWYKKRIESGGWYEEIFISFKRIGDLYNKKGDDANALYYWMIGYDYLPKRSETIYKICNYHRLKGNNNACLVYLKTGISIPYPNDLLLFLEYPVYNYKFIEELSIIGYYINLKKEGMLACQYLLLDKANNIPEYIRDSTFSNNFFYINSISISSSINKKLSIHTRYPYISSSPSIYFDNLSNTYKGVVRAVNYSITDDFKYNIRDFDGKNKVSTINYWAEFDEKLNHISSYEISDVSGSKIRESHIDGFEDIRICVIGSNVYGLAVDWEHCEHNHPSILLLHFNIDNNICKVIPITYNNNICQKNWTLFTEDSKLYAIYSHHPLTIIEINPENGDYKIVKEKFSDYNLKDIRGSANPIKISCNSNDENDENNEWLVLVHEVVQKNTRKYYHRFLKYSSNWDLLEISEPFYFKEFFVEFSLSISYRLSLINIFYSSRDNTTEVMTIEYSKIPWLPKDIKKHLIEIL